MKTTISLDHTNHTFDKTNLVTQRGGYDTYKCKCGLEARRYRLGPILEVRGTAEKIMNCPMAAPKAPAPTAPKKVKIVSEQTCRGGGEFRELTNNSVHDVVACPTDQEAKYGGDVWVMGKTEPIRLLNNEYSENV